MTDQILEAGGIKLEEYEESNNFMGLYAMGTFCQCTSSI